MEIFNTKKALSEYLSLARKQHKKIALTPTMGALHEGHISLILEGKKHADIVVCSIFVNPTQFNDPKDLEKYPRPIEKDIELLKKEGCDILFLPSVEEMYPDANEQWHIDLGRLEQIWEGAQRPGHFQGVTQIVYKLFNLVNPDVACFGQKDFQQVMVVQKMIDIQNLNIQLIICPIIRSNEGLALSSRNARLSEAGKEKALVLFRTLTAVKKGFNEHVTFDNLQQLAEEMITQEREVKLEYFAISETRTLERAEKIENDKQYVAHVVAWIEGVRLIDNMLLND
ncbi:pantoate--beta-alanine ligase [Sphingobacterium bovistauri]|uniref:Pantothenate synthetase n=1 Tax=Sphingobacterium bovistauri TaxID=2781959 RepID=A0ABS7Z2S7_9SPHI|nr:pantoate--beta-alanine ligase [Sphingobacterium bovistauri]MCA5003882.1 pantoate--beta-alanine ligase [Sphingobacterium bovistauri]